MNALVKSQESERIIQKQIFLTFRIAGEYYALDSSRTREVIEYGNVTSVPLMPDFLCGVINLRGEVVPVVDLAIRLGRKPIVIQKRTCIIIVELNLDETSFTLGLLADAVCEVKEFDLENIEEKPSFGAKLRPEFVQGIAKNNGDFIIVLDPDQALSMRELAKQVEEKFN